MEQKEIKKLLYKKYIEPTENNNNDYIGVEIEIPILNLNKGSVDFNYIHNITNDFLNHFNFEKTGTDDDGNIYSATSKVNGDILSFDCSYNNLEFSFGKEKNIFEIQKRFNEYYSFWIEELKKFNYTLTGFGINPYRDYNNNVPIPNGRYRMLFHHLSSYKKYYNIPVYFHRKPKFGMFSSASQVQLDINKNELPITINTFSMLEPIKALLFSNSVLLEENNDVLCYRDIFWENSTQGLNPHNIGMYNADITSIDDILSYIETTSIYCVERDEKYINFPPINITEYFSLKEIEGEYYENGKYKKIIFHPKPSDLDYLRTYKFEDITYRGTIEYRSVCCQPIKDSMTVAAFHLGLKHKVQELYDLLIDDKIIYHHGYNSTELRKLFIRNGLPNFVDENKLYILIKEILNLAYLGLFERGYGEETLLFPLYDRVKKRTNPAKTMLDRLNRGENIENIIFDYGQL